METKFEKSFSFAQKIDQEDPLKNFRDKFYFPTKGSIYFTGNSLGLQPKQTKDYINVELKAWEDFAVDAHFEGKNPWFHYHKFTKDSLARLVGGNTGEVVSMNNLTSNLHLLMVSFYNPSKSRFKIIAEKGAFPSDQYVLETQLRFHRVNPEDGLIEIGPREGEYCLHNEDIYDEIKKVGDELALVLFPGVQYYTGQLFNLAEITKTAHEVGAFAGFDLAHTAGNIPLQLNQDEVDFACWCSYKYLNSGPGGVSGIFVHEKHSNNRSLPRFGGWWGHDEESRFKMKKGFSPMSGADGWQLGNVNILSTAAHMSSLQIFDEAGIERLRVKSIKLTGFLDYLLNELPGDHFQIITPKNPAERGCQLSLLFNKDGKEVFEKLAENDITVDWRDPNVIRISPVPLYNSFSDVFKLYEVLNSFLNE